MSTVTPGSSRPTVPARAGRRAGWTAPSRSPSSRSAPAGAARSPGRTPPAATGAAPPSRWCTRRRPAAAWRKRAWSSAPAAVNASSSRAWMVGTAMNTVALGERPPDRRRPSVAEAHAGPRPQRAQQGHHHPVGVVQRQHVQQAVVGAPAPRLVQRRHAGGQGGVAADHALGPAGGPRREQHQARRRRPRPADPPVAGAAAAIRARAGTGSAGGRRSRSPGAHSTRIGRGVRQQLLPARAGCAAGDSGTAVPPAAITPSSAST